MLDIDDSVSAALLLASCRREFTLRQSFTAMAMYSSFRMMDAKKAHGSWRGRRLPSQIRSARLATDFIVR
jgi:hypothetical protein